MVLSSRDASDADSGMTFLLKLFLVVASRRTNAPLEGEKTSMVGTFKN